MPRWIRHGPQLRLARGLRPSPITSIVEPLGPHLAEEETVLLPIASKWMSPEEFGRLPGHHMMSFRADNRLMLACAAGPGARGHARRYAPEMRTMWTEHMEPAFDASLPTFVGRWRSPGHSPSACAAGGPSLNAKLGQPVVAVNIASSSRRMSGPQGW
jgi:hypothetical protein